MQAKEVLGRKGYMLRLTMPIFMVYLMNIAVNTVDQIMVGNYSQTAVAAVGNACQISWVLTMFFTVLNVASVILVSQFKGAGDNDREQVIYVLSLLCNIVASVVVGVICMTLGDPIFRLMQVEDPVVRAGACSYLAITGGGIIFQALVMSYNAFLKSNSMMGWPLIVTALVNLFNIAGNWALIYGAGPFPELGVTGAAISTTVSRALGALLIALVFRVKIGRLRWRLLKPFPASDLRYMLKIGMPSAGESISYNISQLVVMVFINTMGLAAVNSRMYCQSISSFAYIFSFGLAEATQVVTGYMLGDKRKDDADRRVMRSLVWAVLSAVAFAAVIWFFSEPIVGLFMTGSKDADAEGLREQIVSLCHTALLIDILLEVGRAMNLVMVKALQAAGDVFFPVIMNVISSWLVAVLLSYLLGIVCGMGLVGVWIAFCADECLRGILMLIRWRRGGWRRIDLVAQANAG